MIEWTTYSDEGDTQTAEYGDLLLLIRYLGDSDQWAFVVGDDTDARHSGVTDTESDAKARAIRYCWAVNNTTRERALIYLL